MKSRKLKVRVDQLILDPYHERIYESRSTESLELSFKRTGGTPIYPPAVIPQPDPGMYRVVSGKLRLDAQINMGLSEVEVILYDITDETEIKISLLISTNKELKLDKNSFKSSDTLWRYIQVKKVSLGIDILK